MLPDERVAVDSTSQLTIPSSGREESMSVDTKGPTKGWVPRVVLDSGVCSEGFAPTAAITRKMNERLCSYK